MDYIAFGAVGGRDAVGVVVFVAVPAVATVVDQVDEDADDDGED